MSIQLIIRGSVKFWGNINFLTQNITTKSNFEPGLSLVRSREEISFHYIKV